MKNSITLIVLLITSFLFSQSGINYKAIIKDGSGNILVSQSVDVQFIIYEGVALTNNVYQESHMTSTDANGIIIVNIGGGTTADVFADVAWGNDEHWLNVQVNTGSGLVDLGTTQFMAVPYALNAANVTGLEALDEGDGVGWRLRGKDPANYNNIGEHAVDLSESLAASTVNGASGSFSTAMGRETSASSSFATAMGYDTVASGVTSTALGFNTTASGLNSTAMGSSTIASGGNSTAMGFRSESLGGISTAMGYDTVAESFAATAIGRYNEGGGNPTNWVSTDPLFEIGNGTSDINRTNALTVLKNGTITAPSFDIAEITDDKALITKEYADTNLTASGLEAIGSGYRIVGRDPSKYGNIGFNAVDFSFSNIPSTVFGATGAYSLASGYRATADGANSNALGSNTKALGDNSTAAGKETEARADSSTATGNNTLASGLYSTAMGFHTIAQAYASTALGTYNVGGGNSVTPLSLDPLFEIGKGTSDSNRFNALTVLKNGKIGIDKSSGINAKLDIDHASTQTSPQINIRETSGDFARINFSNTSSSEYWAIAGNLDGTTATDRINFFHSVGGDIMSIRGNGDVLVNNSVVHSSDRRLKKDIVSIPYGLDHILQLQPKAYHWKAKPDQEYKSLGLIAQDVQAVISEIVHTGDDADKTLSVSYTELIPVLIKAIQEQQEIINKQDSKLEQQDKKINGLTAELVKNEVTQKSINQRLEKMEAAVYFLEDSSESGRLTKRVVKK